MHHQTKETYPISAKTGAPGTMLIKGKLGQVVCLDDTSALRLARQDRLSKKNGSGGGTGRDVPGGPPVAWPLSNFKIRQ